jgi:hypothetical protein
MPAPQDSSPRELWSEWAIQFNDSQARVNFFTFRFFYCTDVSRETICRIFAVKLFAQRRG